MSDTKSLSNLAAITSKESVTSSVSTETAARPNTSRSKLKICSRNLPRKKEQCDDFLIDKHIVAMLLGISSETVKPYRKRYWMLGVHYVKYNSRTFRYNQKLIVDWAANRSTPEAHQQAIEAYLASLPSNQPKTRGRKPK